MTDEIAKRGRQGVFFAIAAYTIWGIAPVYFKAVAHVPAIEILAHRVFWAFALVLVLIVLTKKLARVRAVLKSPKHLAILSLATVFIAFNWFMFIWAVANNYMLDASLGYFINPLLNVAIGMIFFAERLRKLQLVAVAMAIVGVTIQIVTFGSVPWVALALAGSFATYGALRKKLPVDSLTGLWLEVTILLPVMAFYFFNYAESSASNMMLNTWQLNVLLIMAGVITTVPLLCFTAAAQRLRYSTLGFFQYIGPSLMFILATVFYGESLTADKMVTFAIIWSALVIYSVDAVKTHRQVRKAAKSKPSPEA
ncbi:MULTISPECIES: EamA family transporter RarD [Gammaproteobacteria]|uniref:EamA family transporter RarD n=1 Tax=Gammaproteobacteria TaxID=1236 RepID=UPI000DD0AB44|nr:MULTISPECIES: EamA family transporter RarD [Gammaproteobacteria]RTE85956.1 EamA family transporter RarD [Aliidiomarina sp. B3213]TCZ90045.1 EamA family transporter RarD [Lysobacter sp. N42]